MGGDLQLKKSYHPGLLKNQARVYDEEQKALGERKKTEARLQEIRDERAQEEIQRKLEESGGRRAQDRVSWMYQGPSDQGESNESLEGYLLGKRRIDKILQGTGHENLKKQAGPESFMALQNANTLRDTATKIQQDPLLAIKQRELEAYEAMMNDPIKRRQLLASMGQTEDSTHTSKSKEDRHSRKHRHRHRSRSREHRHRRRRRSDSRERDDDSREERHRRRRYDSRDRSRERSDSKERHPSRREHRSERYERRRSTSKDRRRDNDRSYRGRSRSPRREDPTAASAAEERARKLAAMQDAAANLDLDREKRLSALEEKERIAREADDKARERSGKFGDREFVNGLRRKLIT